MEQLAAYKGKLAMVTGAGDGIGKMLAEKLAASGMRVCVQDIRAEAAQQVADEIGDSAFPLVFDISDEVAALAAAKQLEDQGEQLSMLWINAGVGAGAGLLKGNPRTIKWAFNVNALGAIWTAQAFVPLLDQDGPTHVGITASSAALRAPEAPWPLYATTKHATFAVAEALQAELTAQNIPSTILCPGLLNTEIWDGAKARPERFGGVRLMDPATATTWKEAKLPEVMWPHIASKIDSGGGYLVCLTDGGETKAIYEARAQKIVDSIVLV